jgi:hypothetical protein
MHSKPYLAACLTLGFMLISTAAFADDEPNYPTLAAAIKSRMMEPMAARPCLQGPPPDGATCYRHMKIAREQSFRLVDADRMNGISASILVEITDLQFLRDTWYPDGASCTFERTREGWHRTWSLNDTGCPKLNPN